jgi:hypothetical protein
MSAAVIFTTSFLKDQHKLNVTVPGRRSSRMPTANQRFEEKEGDFPPALIKVWAKTLAKLSNQNADVSTHLPTVKQTCQSFLQYSFQQFKIQSFQDSVLYGKGVRRYR